MVEIDENLFNQLCKIGLIYSDDTRNSNEGNSNYSEHIIQPWSIWLDWKLNPFDADIIKRVLRTKQGEDRVLDYKKIIHICRERIRQIQYDKLL